MVGERERFHPVGFCQAMREGVCAQETVHFGKPQIPVYLIRSLKGGQNQGRMCSHHEGHGGGGIILYVPGHLKSVSLQTVAYGKAELERKCCERLVGGTKHVCDRVLGDFLLLEFHDFGKAVFAKRIFLAIEAKHAP